MSKRLQKQFILITSLLFCCIYELGAQQVWEKNEMDSLLNVLQKQNEDSTKAITLWTIAQYTMGEAQHTGNWDNAIEWSQKFLNLSTKVNYKLGIGRSNWNLGICWMHKGNYPESIKYFNEAVKASLKNGRKILAVASYQFMADCYMNLGNYKKVIAVCQSGLETLSQMDFSDADQLRAAQENLLMKTGIGHAKLHNYSEALIWFEKVLKDRKFATEEDIRYQIALAQIELQRYDDALKNLLAALPFYLKKLNLKPESDHKGVLGQFYMQIGEVNCKIASLKLGAEKINSYKEGLNYLNKALPLLKEGGGGKEALMNTYALLKEACEATNDYQNALQFTNIYIGLRDSLYNKTTYLKLADLQVKYETEKAAAGLQAKSEKEKIEEKVLREKMLAEQQLQEEKILSEEKVGHEKAIARQKLQQQIAINNEKQKSQKSIATEKTEQEKIMGQKQRTNNLLLMGLVILIITSVFSFLLLHQRNSKKRAIEKAEAMHMMAELELQSLRAQLNPHFMFNSLNAIQELILMEDTERSHTYLSRFSKLVRILLENADQPFISLKKEIDFLHLYLSLENLRIPDMKYSIDSDSMLKTEEIAIPNMILQPFLENAIWHGLSHKQSDKELQVRIYKQNGTVNYEIEDNGIGRKKSAQLKSLFRKKHQSMGMELLSKRFKLLNEQYGSEINTTISDVINNNEVAGTLVTIKVPVNLTNQFQIKS